MELLEPLPVIALFKRKETKAKAVTLTKMTTTTTSTKTTTALLFFRERHETRFLHLSHLLVKLLLVFVPLWRRHDWPHAVA